MRPTFDDLKRLWLIAYSRSAFGEVQRWIDAMTAVQRDRELKSALVCAVVAAYGRPFTQSRIAPTTTVIPLKDAPPPPPELQSTHKDILSMRNKVIGHKDVTPADGQTVTPNVLRLLRDSTGFDLHTVITLEMDEETRAKVKSLCAHFLSYCEGQYDLILQRNGAEFLRSSIPGKMYDILISEPPEQWIREVPGP